jgi:hypothetical protein
MKMCIGGANPEARILLALLGFSFLEVGILDYGSVG